MSHARDNRVSFQTREGYGRQLDSQDQAVPETQKLTDDQRAEIAQAFDLFDQDHDGYVDFHEFKFGLKTLGFDLQKARVYDLLTTRGVAPPWHPQNEPCPGPSLRITAPTFEDIAGTLIASRDPREDLVRAFDLFDVDNDGVISLEDLKQVNKSIKQGTSASEADMMNMIAQADLTDKGGVNRDEFIDMMIAAKRRRGYGK
ncbi:hypothetical protein TD95_004946 [Thielaviopsis punctulata]|uniref:Calmodulin n=1 Tax=Thielaviopsis punctulata TaxID=72032 RepID=A0A0F4ZGY5_9PEZI|nr:hypothetical protein TD95_004946 [Thielaviopsis punctulata]